MKRRVVGFELKSAVSVGSGTMFEGYAAATKNIDAYGEIIAPGAFAADIGKFLRDGFIGGLNHDLDHPIGKPVAAAEDSKGLLVKASLISSLPHAVECHTLLKERVCKKLSIGFRTVERDFLETQKAVQEWWKSVGYTPDDEELAVASHGAVLLSRIRLYECSPVMRPANERADVTDVKAGAKAPLAFEDQLRAVLGQVEDVCERAAAIARRRAEHGHGLPPERRVMLRRMRESIERALEITMPPGDLEAGRRHLERWLREESI